MKVIHITPEGQLRFIPECPVEPKPPSNFTTKGGLTVEVGGDFGYTKAKQKYEQAIASAKASSIEFADQKFATKILRDRYTDGNLLWPPELDALHPFPEDKYDVEVRKSWRQDKRNEYVPYKATLAVIVPKKSEQERLLTGMYEEPVWPTEIRCKTCGVREYEDCQNLPESCDYIGEDVPIVAIEDQLKFYPFTHMIDFAIWYSGMDKNKVHRTYARYLREKKPSSSRDQENDKEESQEELTEEEIDQLWMEFHRGASMPLRQYDLIESGFKGAILFLIEKGYTITRKT